MESKILTSLSACVFIAETSNLAIMEVAFANAKEHTIFGNRYSCLMIFKDPIHRIRLWETLAR